MDLDTGVPIWISDSTADPEYPQLSGDLACEAAIIGGGITGALVAHLLAKAGVQTVLVDKRIPGHGSTIGSTGLLQYEVDTPLTDLIAKVGETHAVHAYRRGLTAITELESLVAELQDTCDFSRRKSLYFASFPEHLNGLRQEYECRKHFGFQVDWLDGKLLADVTSIPTLAAIWSHGDAQINPYRLTQRLLASAVASGTKVFGNTRVENVEETMTGVTLATNAGVIRSKWAIFATGYEANEQLPGSPGKLKSTYALASQPLLTTEGWPEGSLIWETARPYFYARQTSDGRAIVGGEDTVHPHDHTDPRLLGQKVERLKERFAQLFPHIPLAPEYVWGGTFAETKDGLAYIGRVRRSEKIFAALGYGGNGITFSTIAAGLLTDLIFGRENADAAVFSFER